MASGTGHAPTTPLAPLVGEEERVLSIGILGNFGRHVLTSTSDLFQTAADVGFPEIFIWFVGPEEY